MSTDTLHRILRACMWASIVSAVIYAFTGVGLWSPIPNDFVEAGIRPILLVMLHLTAMLAGTWSYIDGPKRD